MAQILRHECCIPGQEQVKEGTMTVVDKLYADKAALRKVLEAFASSDMEARWLSWVNPRVLFLLLRAKEW